MIAYGSGKCSSKDVIFSTDPSWDPSTLALDKVKYQPVSAGLDTRSGTVTWPKMLWANQITDDGGGFSPRKLGKMNPF